MLGESAPDGLDFLGLMMSESMLYAYKTHPIESLRLNDHSFQKMKAVFHHRHSP